MGAGDCWLPGSSETRRGLPPLTDATKASTWPLVSPGTMFDAAERKATHFGALWKPPLIAGSNEGPLAGTPLAVREISRVLPGFQGAPELSTRPARSTTKTSVAPLVSPRTRLEASDSNAMARAKRLSPEITGFVEGPLGTPPPSAFEIRCVVWTRVAAPAPPAVRATAATSAARAVSASASGRRGAELTGTGYPFGRCGAEHESRRREKVAIHTHGKVNSAAAVSLRRVRRLVLFPVCLLLTLAGCGGGGGHSVTFRVPSPSMAPTFRIGDVVRVDTSADGKGGPQRGDIVLVHAPEGAEANTCGVPGRLVTGTPAGFRRAGARTSSSSSVSSRSAATTWRSSTTE